MMPEPQLSVHLQDIMKQGKLVSRMCPFHDSQMFSVRLISILSIVCLVLSLHGQQIEGDDIKRNHWYISVLGQDGDGCGPREVPCQSLAAVLMKVTDQDFVVVMTSRDSVQHSPLHCQELNVTSLPSFTLISDDGPAQLGCPDGSSSNVLLRLVAGPARSERARLHLENVHIFNSNVNLIGFDVSLAKASFELSQLTIDATSPGPMHQVLMDGVQFRGKGVCNGEEGCVPSSSVTAYGRLENVTVTNCFFQQSQLKIGLNTDGHILLDNNRFTNVIVGERAVIGGTIIQLWNRCVDSTVHIRNSQYVDQFSWSPVDSVMNIFESAVLIKNFDGRRNSSRVDIENVDFINNERGLTLQGELENVYVTNCRFESNIAMHGGAGILVLTQRNLIVTNSTFINNSAGNFRHAHVKPHGELVTVVGDEVKVKSKCCKGSVSLIGKGGAIRIMKGMVTVTDCTFKGNTARILGGTIFVDRESHLYIVDSFFVNSANTSLTSQQGDIIYSGGKVQMRGATFWVKPIMNHISLFQHSGDRWSVAVYDVTVSCPIGHRLLVTNTSTYRVVRLTGLKRTYMLDQLSYFCQSCDRHKYSTDTGYLKYQQDPGVFDYFTLMINGAMPDQDFRGTYIYNDIVCQECPYGATCDKHIVAVPNFWGYKHTDSIKFQVCPKGYCCSKVETCTGYDVCDNHRRGVLCGACRPGYSEALFSAKCVPSEECGPIWIWPFAFGTGILYVLFLFFQKDIRNFIFTEMTPAEMKRILAACLVCPQKKTQEEDKTTDTPLTTRVTGNSNTNSNYSNRKVETKNECLVQNHIYETVDTESNSSAVYPALLTEEDSNDGDDQKSNASETPPAPSTDIGAILLIIVLYYFQDAMLFHVKTAFDVPESKFWSQARKVMLGLFKFQVEVAHFVDNVCLLPDLTASQKLMAKTILVPYVLLIFVLLYIFYFLYSCTSRIGTKHQTEASDDTPPEKHFVTKLATGFTLALLFTYQKLATSAFTLLNCVPVGEDDVLFIEGTVKCYTYWQFGVIAYALCCIIPFSVVLMFGPGLIKERKTSLPVFFIACLLPLPFILWWSIRRLVDSKRGRKKTKGEKEDELPALPPASDAVVKVLQGPFRDINAPCVGPICWAGVLIFRRLILVLLFTFINNSLIRVLSMLLVCFIIMLNHVHTRPYKDARVNLAGSASVSALMVVGGINLVRAGFEEAKYVPQGPNETLVSSLKQVENVIMLWFPLCILSLILVFFALKIVLSCVRCCQK